MNSVAFDKASSHSNWFATAMASHGETLLLQVDATQFWTRSVDRFFAAVGRSLRNAGSRYVQSMARMHENAPHVF